MMRFILVWLTALAAWGPGLALAQGAAVPASRGALLYETHCIACHTTQMHWREQKIVTDWASLLAQVRRWQGNASLGWGDDDITEVARHLNERFYRFDAAGSRVSRAPDR